MYPEAVSDASALEREFAPLFNKVELLKSRTLITELSGGLTNRNFRVDTAQGVFVARVSSNSSDLLAIDRTSEFRNSTIAGNGAVS